MIDLVLDDEQIEIQKLARTAAAGHANRAGCSLTSRDVHELGSIGVFGVGLDEADGGAGCGLRAEVLVAEAFGSALAPLLPVATVLAAHVVSATDSAAAPWLGRILEGELRVGLAVRKDGAVYGLDFSQADIATVFDPLTGAVQVVETAGAELTPRSSIDPRVQIVELPDGALGDRIAHCTSERIHVRTLLLFSAMLTGLASVAAERAVAYAKSREQYGKPIGSYQAVKHRCVDMAVWSEAGTSLVRLTAARFDAGDVDLAAARGAMTVASRGARENAASAIQVHGGIGFTSEAGIDALLRRAWLLDQVAGPAARHAVALFDAAVQSSAGNVSADDKEV